MKNPIELLSATGSTADEMAAFFKEKGYVGRRCDSRLCPCGKYLEEQTGKIVRVYHNQISAYELDETPVDDYNTTPVINEFVSRFDAGEFPDICSGF